jgi:hypothetical protein
LARIRFEIVIRRTQNRPFFTQLHEAEEIKRLRSPVAPRRPVAGGMPPELDQPGLAGVQFQAELREPAVKLFQEPLGVLPVLEPDDEVIRPAHDNHVTMRLPFPPPVGPQGEDVVQVHVGEQRRYHAPKAKFQFRVGCVVQF